MPPPKQLPSRVVVVLLVTAPLLAILAAFAYVGWRFRVQYRPRPVTLSEVTAITGIAFPRSTCLCDSLYRPFPTATNLWAAMTMDREDAGRFMETYSKAFKCEFISCTFDDVYTGPEPPSWWPKRSQKAMIANRWLEVSGPYPVGSVAVAVVPSTSGQAIVYLYWSHHQ